MKLKGLVIAVVGAIVLFSILESLLFIVTRGNTEIPGWIKLLFFVALWLGTLMFYLRYWEREKYNEIVNGKWLETVHSLGFKRVSFKIGLLFFGSVMSLPLLGIVAISGLKMSIGIVIAIYIESLIFGMVFGMATWVIAWILLKLFPKSHVKIKGKISLRERMRDPKFILKILGFLVVVYIIYYYALNGYGFGGFNKLGFDKEGYNSSGYNAQGFNRTGYDVEGYDTKGLNVEGFSRTGYDKEGFNASGFNSAGYDREGYDFSGFNKSGYNRYGKDKGGWSINPTTMEKIEHITVDYHKTHIYTEADWFVCVDMAIDVWDQLKAQGISSKVCSGRVDKDVFSNGVSLSNAMNTNHAWVVANTGSDYIAVEATGGYLVYRQSDRYGFFHEVNPLYYNGLCFENPKDLKDWENVRPLYSNCLSAYNNMIDYWNSNFAGKVQVNDPSSIAFEAQINAKSAECDSLAKQITSLINKGTLGV